MGFFSGKAEKLWFDNAVNAGVLYMRHAIETAPKDGHCVVIEDDASADCDVGGRSPEAGDWADGKDDGPIRLTRTHRHPVARGVHFQPHGAGSVDADPAVKRMWRGFFTPVVTVIAAATLLLCCVKQVAAEPPAGDGVVAQDAGLPSRDSKTAVPEVLRTVDRQPGPPASETPTMREQRAAAAPGPDEPQPTGRNPPEGLAREAALAQELDRARRTIERLEAQLQAGPAAEQVLKQERERAAILADHAAAARQELLASTAQHLRALDEERAHSAALASELAMARREIEAQTAQSHQADPDTAPLKQADTANAAQSLEQQRQQMAAALADAAAARQELTANTAQLRQALDEERARNGAMASELATAQQVNQKLAVQFRLIGEQTELRRRAYEKDVAALQQALSQERDKAAAGAADLDAARSAAAARIQPEATTGSPVARQVASATGTAIASPAAPDVPGGSEAVRMIARAAALLGQGDIGAARIVLERAAEMGSPRAVFMLAETYDPNVLSTWKTFGTQGEVARARELYAKAHAGGIREAKERFETLSR